MAEAQILAATRNNIAAVRIVGRASFKVSEQLRQFGRREIEKGVESIIFDLSECQGMDSTILGVFAMLGLEGRGKTELVVVNASDAVRNSLDVVGVSRLCRFADQTVADLKWSTLCEAAAGAVSTEETSETILEAHRTLMNLDEDNVPKFKDVVELLESEIGSSENGT